MNNSGVLFYEKQKFTQVWLWALLLIILIPFIWGLIKQLILGEPWGEHPMSNLGLLLVSLLPAGLLWFFQNLSLETRITEEAIHIDYGILGRKKMPWDTIEKAEVIQYGFVGYGYRISMKYGTVYNVKGNQGLQLYLNKGRKVLLGTQRPEELAEVVRHCLGE